MKMTFLTPILSLLLCSCYRPETPPVQTGSPAFTMALQATNRITAAGGGNFADSVITLTINDSGSFGMTINFSLISGNPEKYPITCSISGLPAGIVPTSSDSLTFRLSYNANFNFSVAADTGIYSCYINIRTPDSVEAYPIRLRVTPPVTCVSNLTGTYSGSDPCSTLTGEVWYTYTATVTSIPGKSSWVNISNFRGLGDSILVQALIGCSSNYIVVPVQSMAGYTFYGSGSYSDGELIIQDTFVHGTDTQICITQLNR